MRAIILIEDEQDGTVSLTAADDRKGRNLPNTHAAEIYTSLCARINIEMHRFDDQGGRLCH